MHQSTLASKVPPGIDHRVNQNQNPLQTVFSATEEAWQCPTVNKEDMLTSFFLVSSEKFTLPIDILVDGFVCVLCFRCERWNC